MCGATPGIRPGSTETIMSYRPPRFFERMTEMLVPPVSAEHVAGDLAEYARSNAQYARMLVSVLPRVIWSAIRRRATIGFIVANAIFTALGLTMALGFPRAPFFAEPWAPARAVSVWAIWVLGCTLAAAYGPRERPAHWNSRLFIGTLLATVGWAAAIGVPIAGVAIALASLIGLFLLFAYPTLKHGTPPPLSIDTLPAHARLFQTHIRWRNVRESLAALIVVFFNVRALFEPAAGVERAAQWLLIAGALFVVLFMYIRAGARPVPAEANIQEILQFHLREIARQRDILRLVPLWYLLPLVPGVVAANLALGGRQNTSPSALLIALGVVVALGAVAAAFAFIWWLNRAGARFLDGQLKEVQALKEPVG